MVMEVLQMVCHLSLEELSYSFLKLVITEINSSFI